MSEQWVQQAITALNNGRFAEGRDLLQRFSATRKLNDRQFMMLGAAHISLGDWQAAAATFREATKHHLNKDDLWAHLALAENQLGDKENAAIHFQRAIKLNVNNPIAASNLASIYYQQSRYAEAIDLARRGTRLHPDKSWALTLLGLILAEAGQFDAAMEAFEASLKIDPKRDNTLLNMANAYVDHHDFDKAYPLFAELRARHDAAHLRRAEAYARLVQGDYEKGWQLAEARLEMPMALRETPTFPRWRGEDLNGKKLLLLAEQGFGDTLQFARFGKYLEGRGAEIIWAVQEPLVDLLAANVNGKIYSRDKGIPAADYYLPLLSLPLATGHMLPESWRAAPYIKAPANGPMLPAINKKHKIGLVWAGSTAHSRDFRRSITAGTLKPLMDAMPNAQFYAPFIGGALDQIGDLPITRLDDLIKNFSDTAFLLKQMDAVVTVDTVIGHLAASMGVPTIMLIAYAPDWRWGLTGQQSPWYDSLTLCRQTVMGDWNSAIQAAIAAVPVRIPNF